VTPAHIEGLVRQSAREDAQLDFKVGRYAPTPEGRAELAKDICAFANRVGGVLVLGVADVKGVASAVRPLETVGDADARHIHDVVLSWCAPVPDVEVIIVADQTGDGFLLISVPASARAPHAVAEPGGNAFSWPIRIGSQTTFLTEPELANAFRTRASRIEDERSRLVGLMADGIEKLGCEEPWLILGLVPAAPPSSMPVDRGTVRDYSAWLDARHVQPICRQIDLGLGRAGPRRVIFRQWNAPGAAISNYLELHTDGVGLVADQIYQPAIVQGADWHFPAGCRAVTDEYIAETLAWMLPLLARHAVDHGGSHAEATVVGVLTDGGTDLSLVDENLIQRIAVCHYRNHGIRHILPYTHAIERAARASMTIDLMSVATDASAALSAARVVGTEILNAFGWAELLQFSSDGRMRTKYWSGDSQQAVLRWSAGNGIELSDESVQ
jgi:hypothetical protein